MPPPSFIIYMFCMYFCPFNSHLPLPLPLSSQSNMNKPFKLCFLLLFLGSIFSATASRSFGWTKNEVALQEIHFQDEIGTRSYEDSSELDQLTTRRIDLENTDYGGTGANDRHDPKSPGRP